MGGGAAAGPGPGAGGRSARRAGLAELRIPHRFEVYAGDHRQQIRQRLHQVVLPWVAQRLVAASR